MTFGARSAEARPRPRRSSTSSSRTATSPRPIRSTATPPMQILKQAIEATKSLDPKSVAAVHALGRHLQHRRSATSPSTRRATSSSRLRDVHVEEAARRPHHLRAERLTPSAGRRRLAWPLFSGSLIAAALAPPVRANVLIGVAGRAQGPGAAVDPRHRARRQARRRAHQRRRRRRGRADRGCRGRRRLRADCGRGRRPARSSSPRARSSSVTRARARPSRPPPLCAGGHAILAPATRHPALTEPRAGPTIFRLAGRDDRQGASAGTYLARKFAGKPVAVVYGGAPIRRTERPRRQRR